MEAITATITNAKEVKAKSGDQDLVFLSGIAEFGFKGDSTHTVKEAQVTMTIGPRWEGSPSVAPVVSLADISNEGYAYSALWRITEWKLDKDLEDRIQLVAIIGVRDTDGWIVRLAYQATVLGKLKS